MLVTTYAAINCKIHSSVRWERSFEIRKYICQRLMIEIDFNNLKWWISGKLTIMLKRSAIKFLTNSTSTCVSLLVTIPFSRSSGLPVWLFLSQISEIWLVFTRFGLEKFHLAYNYSLAYFCCFFLKNEKSSVFSPYFSFSSVKICRFVV